MQHWCSMYTDEVNWRRKGTMQWKTEAGIPSFDSLQDNLFNPIYACSAYIIILFQICIVLTQENVYCGKSLIPFAAISYCCINGDAAIYFNRFQIIMHKIIAQPFNSKKYWAVLFKFEEWMINVVVVIYFFQRSCTKYAFICVSNDLAKKSINIMMHHRQK